VYHSAVTALEVLVGLNWFEEMPAKQQQLMAHCCALVGRTTLVRDSHHSFVVLFTRVLGEDNLGIVVLLGGEQSRDVSMNLLCLASDCCLRWLKPTSTNSSPLRVRVRVCVRVRVR
jgi:hypothetical protein